MNKPTVEILGEDRIRGKLIHQKVKLTFRNGDVVTGIWSFGHWVPGSLSMIEEMSSEGALAMAEFYMNDKDKVAFAQDILIGRDSL